MPFRMPCPGCGTSFSLPDEARGKKVRCKKCSRVFAAGGSLPGPDEPLDVLPVDDQDEEPVAAPGPARPAPPRPRSEARPESASAPAGPVWPWLVGGGVGLFVLGFTAAALVVILFGKNAQPAAVAAAPTVQAASPPSTPAAAEPADAPEPAAAATEPAAPEPRARRGTRKSPTQRPDAERPDEQPPARQGVDTVTVVPLPSPAADLCVGGAGRYLVLLLPAERTLAVFDARQGKVTHRLPVASDNVKIAAGRDRLLAVYPDENLVQRWDLATGQREASGKLGVSEPVLAVAMGSASDGPLLVVTNKGVHAHGPTFLDVQTFQPLELTPVGREQLHSTVGLQVRASANGRVFAVMSAGSIPSGLETYVLEGQTVHTYYKHDTAGVLIPNANGRLVFAGGGARTNKLEPTGSPPEDPTQVGGIPSQTVPYYLEPSHLPPVLGDGRRQGRSGQSQPVLSLRREGSNRLFARLTDPEGLGPIHRLNVAGVSPDSPLPLDRRIHLLLEDGLVILIPPPADRLVLHHLDIRRAQGAPK